MQKDYIRGLVCASVASAAYGLNPLFALPLYSRGFCVESVLALRYMIGMGLLALYIVFFKQHNFRLKRNELLPLISCGVLMSLSSLTLYSSYKAMDVGIASTLLFVYPVMVAVIMWAFFRERLSAIMIACLGMAVAGVVVLNWDGGVNVSLRGVVYVLISALTWALYLIVIRRPSLQRKEAHTITFYSLLFGLPVFLILLTLCCPKGWQR